MEVFEEIGTAPRDGSDQLAVMAMFGHVFKIMLKISEKHDARIKKLEQQLASSEPATQSNQEAS